MIQNITVTKNSEYATIVLTLDSISAVSRIFIDTNPSVDKIYSTNTEDHEYSYMLPNDNVSVLSTTVTITNLPLDIDSTYLVVSVLVGSTYSYKFYYDINIIYNKQLQLILSENLDMQESVYNHKYTLMLDVILNFEAFSIAYANNYINDLIQICSNLHRLLNIK